MLRTHTILPVHSHIALLRFAFLLMFGRVSKSFLHLCASTGTVRLFYYLIFCSLPDCYVLRTHTILPVHSHIALLRFAFLLMFGRVSKSFLHLCASTGAVRLFYYLIFCSLPDCYVLRTHTILPVHSHIALLRFAFLLMFGRVSKSFLHLCASTGTVRLFYAVSYIYFFSISTLSVFSQGTSMSFLPKWP